MSELQKKHQDKIATHNLDATTSENRPKQQPLGFQSHGLVIHDKKGEIVFKQADHAVKKDEVFAFVENYLKKK